MTTAKSLIAALILAPAISNPAHALIQKFCLDDYSQCVEERLRHPNNYQLVGPGVQLPSGLAGPANPALGQTMHTVRPAELFQPNEGRSVIVPPHKEFRDLWRMTCTGDDGAKFIVRSFASARQLDLVSVKGIVHHYVALSNMAEGAGFRVRAVGTGSHGANRGLNAWFSRQSGTLVVMGDNPGSFKCSGAW